jgi:hypothetical protein
MHATLGPGGEAGGFAGRATIKLHVDDIRYCASPKTVAQHSNFFRDDRLLGEVLHSLRYGRPRKT